MELLGFTEWHDEKYQEIEDFAEEERAWEITVQYMKQHSYRFNGFYHQNGEFGTPYFDTMKKLCLTIRSWGALMAEVLDIPKDEQNGRDMSYCYWAWWAELDEFVLPNQPAQGELNEEG
jgi:hypothetical protein